MTALRRHCEIDPERGQKRGRPSTGGDHNPVGLDRPVAHFYSHEAARARQQSGRTFQHRGPAAARRVG